MDKNYETTTAPLSPSKVFVIDIRTWEEIVQIVKTNGVTFRKILSDAYEANKDIKTKCKSFYQHLENYELFN